MTTDATTLLILGASGDLAARLLMPGLAGLLTLQPDRRVQLIGAGAETYTDEEWKARVTTSFDSIQAHGPAVDDLLANTIYLTADVTKAAELQKLLDASQHAPAIYFALPPAITSVACTQLTTLTLPEGTRLALEKPFGTDLASAKALNLLVDRLVPDRQVFRVDHFIGSSQVLNLLGTRFANRVAEPLLSNEHVEKIEISYDETLGLENRARYYDHAGALQDMIQSHLLEVLALVVMEAPASLDEEDVRGHKALALRAVQLWGDDPKKAGRRARYTAGTAGGETMPSYADEAGVDPSLNTETLAEVDVEVRNWRWAGVPITLRSGKALGDERHEILFTFKRPAAVPTGLTGVDRPDRLRLDLKNSSMSLEINVNGPGNPTTIDRTVLTATLNPGELPPYGEVLDGILTGNPALSVRGDTAEQCWRIVGPVIAAWKANEVPLDEYPAGSAGPEGW